MIALSVDDKRSRTSNSDQAKADRETKTSIRKHIKEEFDEPML